jgi:hypothetical protein
MFAGSSRTTDHYNVLCAIFKGVKKGLYHYTVNSILAAYDAKAWLPIAGFQTMRTGAHS